MDPLRFGALSLSNSASCPLENFLQVNDTVSVSNQAVISAVDVSPRRRKIVASDHQRFLSHCWKRWQRNRNLTYKANERHNRNLIQPDERQLHGSLQAFRRNCREVRCDPNEVVDPNSRLDGILPVSYTHLDVYKRQRVCDIKFVWRINSFYNLRKQCVRFFI